MTTTWLRHAALRTRYSCSRNSVNRLHEEGNLPPPSYPCNSAPMWPLELLDFWDSADADERQRILTTWPRWREAISALAAERDPQTQQARAQERARTGMRERSERGRETQARRRAEGKRAAAAVSEPQTAPQHRKRKQTKRKRAAASAVEATTA